MSQWHVQDAWKEKLAEIGITDLQSALAFRNGTVMSDKKRSRTSKVALTDDDIVFAQGYGRTASGLSRKLREWTCLPRQCRVR